VVDFGKKSNELFGFSFFVADLSFDKMKAENNPKSIIIMTEKLKTLQTFFLNFWSEIAVNNCDDLFINKIIA
jgi:hypothetical protein